ncbi:uncharacterized protein LOC106180532 [Lingula anatina]|uniref:Uncharacterized protein LOC106180532 n=1 Tax=Lingula anatina TaxID=7574 RepID=A0A1S3KC28_LINAN|nr:uncharacterized protein LOC106180532 [Lingula anatina]|eukprot:XP_013419994.1 uncharacterized protein LOC106180532 [Lingula anatina]
MAAESTCSAVLPGLSKPAIDTCKNSEDVKAKKVKTRTGKGKLDDKAKSSHNSDEYLTIMKNIQETVQRQETNINSVVGRIDTLEKQYLYHDEYCEENYDFDEQYDERLEDETCPEAGTSSTNRFDDMTKRYKLIEYTDVEVDSVLASSVNDLFTNGIVDHSKYTELTKDENNSRPKNCESLVIVKTNKMVWNIIPQYAKTNDKKLQDVQMSVVKAATLMTKGIDKLAKLETGNDTSEGLGKLIDMFNDSIALLGHANTQINCFRKDLLKPNLKPEYKPLCNHNIPCTTFLFGDDITKSAREVEDSAKMSYKMMQSRMGLDYRNRPYQRGPRFRGRMRGRYNRGRGSSSQRGAHADSKNFSWQSSQWDQNRY